MPAKIYVFASPHQSPQKCKKIYMSTIPPCKFFFFLMHIFLFFIIRSLAAITRLYRIVAANCYLYALRRMLTIRDFHPLEHAHAGRTNRNRNHCDSGFYL